MFELENYIKKYKTSCFAEDAEFDFPVGYENLNAIYYSVGQCKVFAYIGIPKTEKPKNGYPAIILVHGGDGCAYYEWVKKWMDKGYVAIAPDFDANYATDLSNRRVANSLGGPKGYGSFKQLESEHPWTFFSVLSILNALDLLNAKQSVDKDKISICGLSWGGVLSLFALAVDHRFKSAVIIYSSAYVLDTEFFLNCFKGAGLTDEDKQKYTEVFDPQAYLERIKTPILFIAGADDVAFTMQSRKKTTDKITSEKRFSYRKNLPHGHSAGRACDEAINFVSSKLSKENYPTVEVAISKEKISIDFVKNYSKAQLIYTEKYFNKVRGEWQSIEILDDTIDLPKDCKYFFVSVIDGDNYVYSSDLYEI